MKTLGLSRYSLLACCVAIAACSQAPQLSPGRFTPQADGAHERLASPLAYSVVYSFNVAPDGNYPEAGLIDVSGTLYGTTIGGGKFNVGTIFTIAASGGESVFYSFSDRPDAFEPGASLIDVSGTLYGTTYQGGKNGDGTVFSITTGGTEEVLYSFKGGKTDGDGPAAALIDVDGTLYGTTYSGGKYDEGTVFSVTTGGTEKVLHSFGKGSDDGAYPLADLINVKGTLYGTTQYGGASFRGTVFSITTGGREKVLHSFGGGSADGSFPYAGLIDVKGTLYGVTTDGGSFCQPSGGCGTVFSITTGGTEKVLHSFGSGSDGSAPEAALIDVSGTLYGTTALGGVNGDGTVFSITTGGAEVVMHSFAGSPNDGNYPVASLIDVSGTLYGTTEEGGANVCGSPNTGCGTVFSITP